MLIAFRWSRQALDLEAILQLVGMALEVTIPALKAESLQDRWIRCRRASATAL